MHIQILYFQILDQINHDANILELLYWTFFASFIISEWENSN